MHIVIIGAGEVGTHIAKTLIDNQQDVVIVDRDQGRVDAAREALDAMVLAGNGSSPEVLRDANIARAHMLVAVTDSDDSNLIACMAARAVRGKALTTIARVRDLSYFGPHAAAVHSDMGVDLIVSPDRTAADSIARAIQVPGAASLDYFADGRVVVSHIVIRPHSPAIGQSFGELREHSDYHAVGYTRAGALSIAYDADVIESGDHLFLISDTSSSDRMIAELSGETRVPQRVMIYGASRTGMHLAAQLHSSGIDVRVIERDLSCAQQAVQTHPEILIVQGDALDRESLVAEHVDQTDVFVSAHDDDAINMLASLTARQLGAKAAFAVVSRGSLLPLVDAMQIDAVFSPRLSTADAILQFVRQENVEQVYQFGGGAEMLQLRTPEGCAAVREPIAKLTLPPASIIAAIVRDDAVIYPRGGDQIRPGDRVITLVQPTAIEAVEKLFSA